MRPSAPAAMSHECTTKWQPLSTISSRLIWEMRVQSLFRVLPQQTVKPVHTSSPNATVYMGKQGEAAAASSAAPSPFGVGL